MSKVNLESFTKDELQKIVSECSDKTELATRLGFTFTNGKVHKKVVALVQSHGISIDHFDPAKKVKARRKYPIVKKNCPVCGKEFETQQGHPKEKTTCSYECSNTYFADIRHTDESKEKTSNSLNYYHQINGTTQEPITKCCPECSKVFQTYKVPQIYCSGSCARKASWKNEEYRNNLVSQVNQRVASGQHKGCASRAKLEPSFPEKITIQILNELSIKLEREHKVDKWFIDFADVNRKIAIEIDGKQHEWSERKASDEVKDAHLISQGWRVHRIKWKKLTVETRQELKNKLEEILTGPGV